MLLLPKPKSNHQTSAVCQTIERENCKSRRWLLTARAADSLELARATNNLFAGPRCRRRESDEISFGLFGSYFEANVRTRHCRIEMLFSLQCRQGNGINGTLAEACGSRTHHSTREGPNRRL